MTFAVIFSVLLAVFLILLYADLSYDETIEEKYRGWDQKTIDKQDGGLE